MAPPTKSTKVATRGAKQILEENVSTLNFYRNMVFIASGVYLVIMIVFFEFTPLTISLTLLSAVTYVTSYQFMMYMARAKYSESGQLIDSGVDLNMEGGIAEHIKDLIILTSGCQVLSLTSNYFWCLWTLAPIRGFYMLWTKLLAPWFFSSPEPQPDMDEKKQRKLERKMARRQ
ncbi:transmembrane protein 208 isoform X1 [Fopius arisanus]|uniref:Transmembrane protein 208 n=1 Tax=Fopius arisanus TaxID=64838 RepID=A0A9R1U5H7_9HYME|nr:PREDICTED: transmembrane protein 208 isoform X1 [Fopius arisanus]